MKVVIVENENFREHRIGGISSYIKAIVKCFEKNKVSYSCVGAGFKNIGLKNINENKVYSISDKGISNVRFFLKLFLGKRKIFKGVEGAVFHLHHPYMALALRSLKLKNIFVLTLHSKQDQSFRDNRNSFLGLFYNALTRKSLKLYDVIIADNQPLLDYYHRKYGIDINMASIISPPVDLDVFKPLNRSALRQKYNLNEADKLILYAGRIENEKNLELLIRSCKLLNDEIKDITLWIVGEGSQLIKIQDYSRQVEFSKVRFIKTLSSEDLAEVMNCADVFALTSLHEGGPIVVKEALACNLAVVSVDVGDVAEVIQGMDGCYIAANDEKDFADNLRKALEHYTQSNLRESVYQYGIEEFGANVVKLYARCNK